MVLLRATSWKTVPKLVLAEVEPREGGRKRALPDGRRGLELQERLDEGPRLPGGKRTEGPRLPLLQQPRRFDGPVREDDVRARAAQAAEVPPAVSRRGCYAPLVSSPARQLATYEDLLALPEETRAELIGGTIVVAPSPSPIHQSAVAELYAELRAPFQRARGGPGGWWLIPDVDVAFGAHDVLRPDISGWRRERVPEFPTARPVRHRPDWICEGLSPATAARDQSEKRSIYQRAGVPWFWQLDPTNRTLSVLRLTAEGYVVERVVGEVETARLPPFDAMELDIQALFPPAPSNA